MSFIGNAVSSIGSAVGSIFGGGGGGGGSASSSSVDYSQQIQLDESQNDAINQNHHDIGQNIVAINNNTAHLSFHDDFLNTLSQAVVNEDNHLTAVDNHLAVVDTHLDALDQHNIQQDQAISAIVTHEVAQDNVINAHTEALQMVDHSLTQLNHEVFPADYSSISMG